MLTSSITNVPTIPERNDMADNKKSVFRIFFWSLVATVVTLVAALVLDGPLTMGLVGILAILEVSLSFDNAVINASILGRMSEFWQKIFLTVGIAIAVFGMRIFFPVLLVSATTDMSIIEAFQLALAKPDEYESALIDAHPAIAAFGGAFLLMIVLDFMFEKRDLMWLRPIESLLAKVGSLNDKLGVVGRLLGKLGINVLSCAIASASIVGAAYTIAPVPSVVMTAGFAGLITYLLVNGISSLFETEGEGDEDPDDVGGIHGGAEMHKPKSGDIKKVVGKAAFFLFLYLEVLDASFSFDGVVGAFAISSNIFVIAAGLGVGAMYIRSLTVYLVNQGTLSKFEYLEHGAHWAIGTLAVILLLSIEFEVPEVVTGLTGVGFIGASFVSSMIRNRRMAKIAAAKA